MNINEAGKKQNRSSSKDRQKDKLNTSKGSIKGKKNSSGAPNFLNQIIQNQLNTAHQGSDNELSLNEKQNYKDKNTSNDNQSENSSIIVVNQSKNQNKNKQQLQQQQQQKDLAKKKKSKKKKIILHELTTDKLKKSGQWPDIEANGPAPSTSQNLKDPKYFANHQEILEYLIENQDIPPGVTSLTTKQLKHLKILQTKDGRYLVHDLALFERDMRLTAQNVSPKRQLFLVFFILIIFMLGCFLTLIQDVYIILIITASNVFGLLIQELISVIVKRKNKIGKNDSLKYLTGITFLLFFFILYLIDKSVDEDIVTMVPQTLAELRLMDNATLANVFVVQNPNNTNSTVLVTKKYNPGKMVSQALAGVLLSIGISQLGATRIEGLAKDVWHNEDDD